MIKAKINKISKIIFVISVLFFISSVSFKLYFCNKMTVKNGEYERASIDKKVIEEEIEKLKFNNSLLSSIIRIENKSREMGFIEMEERLISIDPYAPIQVALVDSR